MKHIYLFFIRTILILAIWIPTAVWVGFYAQEEVQGHRFEYLVLSNGKVSSIQRESWFQKEAAIEPARRVLEVEGQKFQYPDIAQYLSSLEKPTEVSAVIEGKGEFPLLIRAYSQRDIQVYLLLPVLLSLIFLGFSILTPLQRFTQRKTQEAVEVFSLLCFGFSMFFLTFLPSMTLGMLYPFSIFLPALAAMVFHLFFVYPKKKLRSWLRNSVFVFIYLLAGGLIGLQAFYWFEGVRWLDWVNLLFIKACLVFALASLGHTLFTSRDFWARRRARLLSLGFAASFIGLISIFVSFLWDSPQVSLERLLAVSLLFPVVFAVIFSKENVFNLERMFRHGLHQALLLGIAVTLAVLVGVLWSEWGEGIGADWLLWAAIAMVVVLVAQPARLWSERQMSRLVRSGVRYPAMEHLFRDIKKTEDFLRAFGLECERHLNLQEIYYRFFWDPTLPWGEDNEQIWRYSNGELHRVYQFDKRHYFRCSLQSGSTQIGELRFSEGDDLAFDPQVSQEWREVCHSFARYLELLCLREFLERQESMLAVGRMQALLAHEMKNPLAVIQVCSGLLRKHVQDSEEADELVETIQQEIKRISTALQGVFEHSGKGEEKSFVVLLDEINDVLERARRQFPGKVIDQEFIELGKRRPWEELKFPIYTEREGLKRSIQNLIVNAFEAESSWVCVRVIKTKTSWKLEVEDQGKGLDQEIELFKPFVTTKTRGTGLGLAHVKAFMDRQSGRISVDRNRNQGTLFTLEFSPNSLHANRQETAQ